MTKKGEGKTKTDSKSAQKPGFVHLHTHTHYSVLDGLTKIEPLVEQVKAYGMDAVAITDHGTLSGAIEFYKTAQEAGVKPIIGMEAYVAARGHLDKEPQADKSIYHLTLLAMNDTGYKNLMRLSTIAHLEGFYYKPRIDHQLLEKYGEGLLVLSGCIGGEVGDALRQGDYAKGKQIAGWYKSVFGDRYYLEVQDHGHQWQEQDRVNREILKLADELAIDAVVTSDSHYVRSQDQPAHEVLLCVQTGSFLSDEKRMSLKDMDLHVEDPETIAKRWSDHPELLANTVAAAERCQVQITMGEILIPHYESDNDLSAAENLQQSTWEGLAKRYLENPPKSVSAIKKTLPATVKERAEFELETIHKMGFDDYFLIVADFVNWGKSRGIVFGPGRGSAAGSVVSYALNITDLDPLEYDLLFERFLNPERVSMPDIDIDIQDNRRDEVIAYVTDKYGKDRVASIVTFGTMAARNAIRDVARVLEVPYAEADRLAKMVPPPVQGRHTPLAIHLQNVEDIKREYETNPNAKRVFDLAVQLEGTIRSHGVHAAGVVIAPEDIVNYIPLEMAQKGVIATQYAMGPIEDLGLLKMDFLGLSNLTIIKNSLRIIKKVRGQEVDINRLPLDDKPTYDLLSRGETTGVFQFESAGMKRYLKQLKPSRFEDIVAMGALYRPGPLTAGLTDKFIARKNGLEEVSYEHEKMKAALEPTYGVLVYQEQVMRIAVDMCGFSGGQADTLRKAIGKKKLDLMAKMKAEFTQGMVKHSGVSEAFAAKFWKDLEGFADYAFNKSHSACYGLISYQTAYLKANYPDAFMAALMTSGYEDTDRLASMISECAHMGLEVLPPDVNQSFLEFSVVPDTNQIRFGLVAVKNVGAGAVEEILRAREDGGMFSGIEDFIKRVDGRLVNRKAMESLIKAGAFDSLQNRDLLLHNLELIMAQSSRHHKQQQNGQTDLFGADSGVAEIKLTLEPPPRPTPDKERLAWERELMGVYLSDHPLKPYEEFIKAKLKTIKQLKRAGDGELVETAGIVSTLKEITTKNGARMAFVNLEDSLDSFELILFPQIYEKSAEQVSADSVVLVRGKISTKDRSGNSGDEPKLLVDEILPLNDQTVSDFSPKTSSPKPSTKTPKPAKSTAPAAIKAGRLFIHIKDPQDHEQLLKLKKTLNRYPGSTEAILVLGQKTKSALRLPFRVDISGQLRQDLEHMLEPAAVVVR